MCSYSSTYWTTSTGPHTQRHQLSEEAHGTAPLPLPSTALRWGCIWPGPAPSSSKATPAQLAALHSYYTAITPCFQRRHFPQEHTSATQTSATFTRATPVENWSEVSGSTSQTSRCAAGDEHVLLLSPLFSFFFLREKGGQKALQTHVHSLHLCKLLYLLPLCNHIRKTSAKVPPQLKENLPVHAHSYLFTLVIHVY